ncbi:MAG TPA: sigma-70 family RNA polymerase sigma factor [Rhizomicrobium sp.]|jgi:RNA polymerase sigma-70 factor (ECF subfamily)
MSDETLAALAAAGDAAAFGQLTRRHQSQLRGFLRRLTRGDAALADDLAQESFLEAWRKIAQFRSDGAFAGWLMRIGWSRYLMTARRRKLEPLDDAAADIPAEPVDTDARLDLEKAMMRLSLPERAALTLCHALDYSNEEAARLMDMPLGTVKSHIARGREKLRALLRPAP